MPQTTTPPAPGVTERPILFNSEMVAALLAGRKSVTRRPAKLTPAGHVKEPGSYRRWHPDDPEAVLACPLGKVGERLWVRETFWALHDSDMDDVGNFIDCGPCLDVGPDFHPGWDYVVAGNCSDPPTPEHQQTVEPWEGEPTPGHWWLEPPAGWDGNSDEEYKLRGKWTFLPWGDYYTKHPSIHMPRWAARVLLEITGVRLERLHALTEEDARLEGVRPAETTDGDPSYALGFIDLWDDLHTKVAQRWVSNPLVWRVEFKRVSP